MHLDTVYRSPKNQQPPNPGYKVEVLTQDFFKKGYQHFPLLQNEVTNNLIDSIKKLEKVELENPYSWKEKYSNAFDIYPNTYSYLPHFIDFLFSQEIPQKIRTLLSEDLYLGDLTLRKVNAGQQYASWHRDTNVYGSNSKGRMPVLHKLIFYPQLDHKPTPQLKVIPGSHRRMFTSKLLDKIQSTVLPSIHLNSSNNHALFFNTALFHAAEPVKTEFPAFRLIYCFCHKYQLSQFAGREALHEIYQERLKTIL